MGLDKKVNNEWDFCRQTLEDSFKAGQGAREKKEMMGSWGSKGTEWLLDRSGQNDRNVGEVPSMIR